MSRELPAADARTGRRIASTYGFDPDPSGDGHRSHHLASWWRDQIQAAQEANREYFDSVGRAWDTYRNEGQTLGSFFTSGKVTRGLDFERGNPVNIFYANVETQANLILSQKPIPVVRRRSGRSQPAERVAAEIIQRCLQTELDSPYFNAEKVFKRARQDYLVSGRGMIEVEHVRTGEVSLRDPIEVRMVEGKWVADTGEAIPSRLVERLDEMRGLYQPEHAVQVAHEGISMRHLDPLDVLIQPVKRWEDVMWIATVEFPTRRDIAERWGEEKAALVNYTRQQRLDAGAADSSVQTSGDSANSKTDHIPRAKIWRIFDRANRRIIYLDDGGSGPDPNATVVAIVDDELELLNFFPIPEPIQTVRSNRTLTPMPEYVQYESLVNMMQLSLVRFFNIVRSMRVLGFIAGADQDTFENAFATDANRPQLIALTKAMTSQVKAQDLVAWLPLDVLARTASDLSGAMERMEMPVSYTHLTLPTIYSV